MGGEAWFQSPYVDRFSQRLSVRCEGMSDIFMQFSKEIKWPLRVKIPPPQLVVRLIVKCVVLLDFFNFFFKN